MANVEVPHKIKQVLKIISDRLKDKEISWCIAGSCALLLHGIDIKEIDDIDIISDKEGAFNICKHFNNHEVSAIREKMSDNLVSVMGILVIDDIKVEVKGDLKYKGATDTAWHTSSKMLRSPQMITVGDFSVPVASLDDLLHVYKTMGRDKDLKRVEAIKKAQT